MERRVNVRKFGAHLYGRGTNSEPGRMEEGKKLGSNFKECFPNCLLDRELRRLFLSYEIDLGLFLQSKSKWCKYS